jgi:hypothetical protein
MKFRGLFLAIVVLAGLVGLLYWSNHRKPAPTAEASAEASPKILSLKQADITRVDIKKKDAPDLVLTKNSAGKWQITDPKPMRADQGHVEIVLNSLSSLSSDRLVEEKASNLADYGLSEPALQVTIGETGNKQQHLLIGDDTPTRSGAYAMLEGDPRVFTIASYSKNSVDKTANDLRDLRLLPVDADKVSQVELKPANKPEIDFGRTKDGWQMTKPQYRTEGSEVGNLVRKLTDAKMELSASGDDEKKAVAAFASGKPVATAKLTDDQGTQELQVRKDKNDYYAKSSAVPGVYKVMSDIGLGMDKKADDFRKTGLWDFGYVDPDKIEFHDGAKTYFFTHSGSDWWSANGKKLDPTSMDAFLDDLRSLSSTKFVDSGFTAPALDITVTSNNEKRVEKVLFSRSGDDYVVKQQNDPGLYQVTGSNVDNLKKLASEVKDATSAKKESSPAKL